MRVALLATLLGLLSRPPTPQGLLYAPPTGSIWDPSCIRIGGRTHCIFMYSSPAGADHGGYASGLLATAEDGVHFTTVGPVAPEAWVGVGFFKAFFAYLGPDAQGRPLFVMNHGTEGNTTNRPPPSAGDPGCPTDSQCLRWHKSNDLLHWTPLYTNHPDPSWYTTTGGGSVARWDAASMMPDPAGAGWLAFPTATVPGRVGCGAGLMRSPDGLNWSVAKPPSYDWGELGVGTSMELGGVEKIGDRYWMIGGCGNGGYRSYPHGGDPVSAAEQLPLRLLSEPQRSC